MRKPAAAAAHANAADEHAPSKRNQRAVRVEPGRTGILGEPGDRTEGRGRLEDIATAPLADATDATTPSTDSLASVASD